jgi:quercetin dioxygenase-like cupin family protein
MTDLNAVSSFNQAKDQYERVSPHYTRKKPGRNGFSEGFFQVGCMHFDPGGVIGFHPAGVNQLFLVVSGSGWVRDETSGRIPIRAGQAVYWEAGEGHESGTETGMTAIVIEGPGLNPAELMPLLEGR